ncbi:hypothetical protein Elgi_69120 [Paenibacillus elgii]|uniref:NAD-binding protein n=1 Tax=Paenibacillus elgii TaxID=189691 RepID=UPI002D7D2740|nr:hypothetical protein Elgi_69120 [Paenibacillus elgii]
MFAKCGANVTILEGGPRILPGFEVELVHQLTKQMTVEGIAVVPNAIVLHAEENEENVIL